MRKGQGSACDKVSLSVGEEHVSDALDHLELIDIAFLVDVQFRTSILEIIIEVMIQQTMTRRKRRKNKQ
jgi:hypothetical protein